ALAFPDTMPAALARLEPLTGRAHDERALWRRLAGVDDEGHDHLLEQVTVAPHRRKIGVQLHRQHLLREQSLRAKEVEAGSYGLVERDHAIGDTGPGIPQEALDRALDPRDRALHGFGHLAVRP